MTKLPLPLKMALSDFIINLQKGLIDDERWNWDVEKSGWKEYQKRHPAKQEQTSDIAAPKVPAPSAK